MMVLTLKESEMKLKTPFRMVISGPSGSGKTTFCYDLIKAQNYMLEVPVRRIIYFYMDMNPVIARIAKLEFVEVVKGFNYDLVEDHDGGPEGLWILIDDHINTNIFEQLADIFCIKSRSKNINITYLSQNLFSRAKNAKDYNRMVLLNSSISVLFDNRRDETIATHIGRTAFPRRYKWFLESYREACDLNKSGHGYIMIQSDPGTRREVELRTRIFFKTEVPVLFWERNKR